MDDVRASYTTTEAAALLKVQPRSVTKAIERGRLKAEKRGRDWHIDAAELARFQNARSPLLTNP